MRDLERVERELRRRGKGAALQKLADSADGQALQKMLDGESVRRAAESGDSAAIRQMLGTVLGSDEGRRLAQQIQKLMDN